MLIKDKDISYCLLYDENNEKHVTDKMVKDFMAEYSDLAPIIAKIIGKAVIKPPPITLNAPFKLAMLSQTFLVPSANEGTSNIPIGPFHTTVLAFFTSLAYNAAVLGPISQPSSLDGISSKL